MKTFVGLNLFLCVKERKFVVIVEVEIECLLGKCLIHSINWTVIISSQYILQIIFAIDSIE